jgi:uncharacterized protein YcaQ
LDPTNVVARNHLLILWSRIGQYDRADLDRLLWTDKALYETISFILPSSDRPLHEVHTRKIRKGFDPASRTGRMHAWIKKNEALRRDVIARLRKHGSLPLTAFEDRAIDSWTSSGWTSERNVSQMLMFLMRLGEVSVGGRVGGKKMWTLTKSWLPRVRPMTAKAAARAATERALGALGVATFRDLELYYALNRHVNEAALASLERDGIARRVTIEGLRGAYFAHASLLRKGAQSERTTLLSPFDSLIINRARTETLFGMRYRMEIYFPKPLRVRGFWAMPILHGNQLIGTVDPKVDRQRGVLEVITFRLERDAPRDRKTRRAIEDAVDDLAAFTGAREVVWPKGIASSYSRR